VIPEKVLQSVLKMLNQQKLEITIKV